MDTVYILDKIYRSSLVRDNGLYQGSKKDDEVRNINGSIRNKIDIIYRPSNKKYSFYQDSRKNGEIRDVNGNLIKPDILDTFDIDMMFNGNEKEEGEELSPLETGLENIWNYWMEHMIPYLGLSATEELKEDIEEIKDNYDDKMYLEAAKVIEKNVEQYELLARENGSREKAEHLNYIRIMFDDVKKLIQISHIYKKKFTTNEKTTQELDKTVKEYLMRLE